MQDIKAWNQKIHTECALQLALYPAGRDKLRGDPRVREALKSVAQLGLSAEARQFAEGALIALKDEELQVGHAGATSSEQLHVMLSCVSVPFSAMYCAPCISIRSTQHRHVRLLYGVLV